ncbi:MAG: hypothetical protein J6A01_06800, partial [Proteobacteria bacterium]|nr:hypothetical protein [Pseudomonadota bacterium]
MQFEQCGALSPTSRRRVISLWFGNANRIDLLQNNDFTGSIVLATVFTVEGFYHYYICFFSLSHQVTEIWKTSPDDVKVTEAPTFEKNLFAQLAQMGIELLPIGSDNKDFPSVLMSLPMAYNDENETAPSAKFLASSQEVSFTIS